MKHVVYQTRCCCIIFFIIICFLLNSNIADAGESEVVQGKKVLVVASYHSEYKWVEDLSLVENKNGQRYLNVNTLKKNNLKLIPEVIIGTKLITPK